MSLFGALSIGVTSLQSQSNAIGIISDNISNSTTVGYKEGLPSFDELVAGNTVSAKNYTPESGVAFRDTLLNSTQGIITTGTAATNIAISGEGFVPVSQNASSKGGLLYTRAGSFTPDANGNLVNAVGFYLQGFSTDANGNVASALNGATNVNAATATANLTTVNVNQFTEKPVPTTTASIQANLQSTQAAYAGTPAYNASDSNSNLASGAIASQFNTPITVIDSSGVSHTLTAGFLKTATNSWAVELYAQPTSDTTAANGGQVAAGTVTFNGDGTLASISPSLTQPINVNWQNGTSNSISLNLGTAGAEFGTAGATSVGKADGLSQNAGDYNVGNIQQNGIQAGTLDSVIITSDGYVAGNYSNGTSHNLYKIPVANFISPNQLQAQTGDVFTQTADSGPVTFLQSGQSGAGTIKGDALESSNVDTSVQLTNLIIAQNAYQSSSKILSTTDTMLQDLTALIT